MIEEDAGEGIEARHATVSEKAVSSQSIVTGPAGAEQCRIVAIGASAGGLEPFEKFFDHVTSDTGMAYVVIQHLSPDFRSMMDELLSRHSNMEIRKVTDGMRIEPNIIYLNPPRTEMELRNGKLSLHDVGPEQALHLPINTFLNSLAEERGESAIAIILSGTGSDGTLGAVSIKRENGTVLVQEPTTAKFDGMPSSVIAKIQPDAIATPEELGRLMCRIALGEEIVEREETPLQEPREQVFSILRERFGTDFNHYKNATIERRLVRRTELQCEGDLQRYVGMLEQDDEEVEALYADFLIEVTEFFRDKGAFDALQRIIVPPLVDKMDAETPLRVWVPGCASGEEAYSIAIALMEEARRKGKQPHIKILATDIHSRSLDAANGGVYEVDAVKGIPKDVRDRYFERLGSRYQIRPFVRQTIVFSTHNILRDPPFTRIDLVSCRNLLIYLNETAQQKALAYFHFSLLKDGYLFLGPSETVGNLATEFNCIEQRWRIFKKRRNVRLVESMTHLPRAADKLAAHGSIAVEPALIRGDARRVSDRTFDLLLKRYAPPGFLINRTGELIRIFGDAGRYINVSEGNFSQHIDDLVRGDLRVAIAAALDRAKSSQALPFERRIRIRDEDGDSVALRIELSSVSGNSRDRDYLLLTINEEDRRIQQSGAEPSPAPLIDEDDSETFTVLRQTIQDLEHELQSTEETLQTTIEELETSNEELQATNEELIASNEELQSTNEELHSVNEELYTVSAEHQRKIVELTEMTDDMAHLLKATEIGTVFVDADLHVRRFTPAATLAFNVLDQDVGRPLSHITNRLSMPDFVDLVQQVVSTGEGINKDARVGDKFLLLRILPYVRAPGDIAGAVVTTIDVTDLKRAQTQTEQLASRYGAIVEDLNQFIFRWNRGDDRISFYNSAFLDLFGIEKGDLLGQNIRSVILSEQHEAFFSGIDRMQPGEVRSFTLESSGAGERKTWREGMLRAIGDDTGEVVEYQAVGRDITTETAYRIALAKLSRIRDDSNASYENVVEELLTVGSEFFGMPLGVFSEISEREYRVRSIVGGERFGLKKGQVLPLQKTFCRDLKSRREPIRIDHASQSEHRSHEAHIESGIEAYIGQKITIGTEVRCAINFASRIPRTKPFNDLEVDFIRILAEWIGRRVERHYAMESLTEARDELQLLIDNVRAKIWYKDDKNRILRLNKPAAMAMNLTVEEATGADTYDLFPEMAAKYHKDDLKVIESGQPLFDILEEFTPLNSRHAWVKTDKIPYIDPETGDKRILVISMDVTALKLQEAKVIELNTELSDTNERLLHTNQGLQQFAHVASHDLQEPLRKLMQFTEYLVADCGDSLSDDGKYFVDIISGSALRMRQLISDLLALSSASGRDLSLEQVSLDLLFKDLLAEMDVSIREVDANVEVETLPNVVADPTLINQLFQNLLSNALKYRRSDVAPAIKVTSTLEGEEAVIVSISDNGIGISDEYREKIFDAFTRLHDRTRFDGTGIGLAICRTACERHGWTLSVESTPETGSTFSVRIPVEARVS